MSKLDVRRAITERGYTVSSFSKQSGIKLQNLIQNIINGNPTVAKLQQVAEWLKCDIKDLFYDDIMVENEINVPDNTETSISTEDSTITCPYCSKRFILLDK